VSLPPLSGDPDGVRRLALRLTSTGRRLESAASVLVALVEGAAWDGGAADGFARRVGVVPGVLRAAATRHLAAAPLLRSLADALEDSQRIAQAAVARHRDAHEAYARLEDRLAAELARHPHDPATVATLQALQREQVQEWTEAERRHAAAWSRFEDADRRCARGLDALSDDALADPTLFRALRGLGGVAHGISAAGPVTVVAPELAPIVLAADTVGAASDWALLVGYGEGDAVGAGISSMFAAVGWGGSVLKLGATAKGTTTTQAPGNAATHGAAGAARLTAGERLVVGAARDARARIDRVRATFAVPGPVTASSRLGGPPLPVPATGSLWQRGAAAARRSVRSQLDRRFLDDWRAVTANGPEARSMYLAGTVAQQTARFGPKAVDRLRDDCASRPQPARPSGDPAGDPAGDLARGVPR
jgi:hypothetical protein